jgi:hypothetical protein
MRVIPEISRLVPEANLAPSVHNTQPTRWRQLEERTILVLEDGTRRLQFGDPAGRDAAVSHGAAIEGLSLACAERGWSVRVTRATDASDGALRPVACLELAEGAAPDPLAAFVAERRTYRGRFAGGDPAALERFEVMSDVTVVRDRDGIGGLAALNDEAGLRTFRDAAFRAELLSWMRLSRRDPRWNLDGLNAEAMEMSSLEAACAGMVLRRGVFETFDRLGVARKLVGEAAVVRSALAVLLFHRPADEDPVSTGRRFHRLWLEITAAGLAADPMAVLADDRAASARIKTEYRIGPESRLITAFRVGRAPPRRLSPKPRLSAAQLVADKGWRSA